MYKVETMYADEGVQGLYYTDSVLLRLANAIKDYRRMGWSIRYAAKITGIHASVWNALINRGSINLRSYLQLSGWYSWDLSRDVNYIYAEMVYSPAELVHRVERLFPDNYNLYACCRLIDTYNRLSPDTTWRNINYAPGRKVEDFGDILYWVAAQEREWGFVNPLDLED